MIIFNDNEYNSDLVDEGRMIVIRTPKGVTLTQFYNKVKAGEDISDCKIEIFNIFDKENNQLTFAPKLNLENKTGLYAKIYTQTEVDEARIATQLNPRSVKFEEFEKQIYNQKTSYTFVPTEEPLTKEQFEEELLAAMNILPTLWHEDDLELSRKRLLTTYGERLIRLNARLGADNPIPNRELINFYENNLAEQERRLINRNYIHPRKVFDLCRMLKMAGEEGKTDKDGNQKYNSRLLPESFLVSLEKKGGKILLKNEVAEFLKPQFPDAIDRARPMFEAEFRGHAPMVINEYIDGQLLMRRYIDDHAIDDDTLMEIVKGFNQKNVAKVAKYKNKSLLALDGILDFANFKESLIETLGIYLDSSLLSEYKNKHLFDYVNAHKDISVSQLTALIKGVKDIDEYDLNADPQLIINRIANKAGYIACKKYEKKYEYSFADNEIAIKGRHLSVSDGKRRIYILAKDDYRNFIVGDYSNGGVACCQHFGNAGEACVWKVTEDPFSCNMIIEEDGKIMAQAFCFTDELTKTFVFDNIEYLQDNNASLYTNLIEAFVEKLPYPNVHLGMGYTEPGAWNGIGIPVKSASDILPATMPSTLTKKHVYSDYHPTSDGYSGARALKNKGHLIKYAVKGNGLTFDMAPDEPTKYDILTDPRFSFIINSCDKSVEERIKIVEGMDNDPLALIKLNPNCIGIYDTLSDEIQDYVLEHYPDKLEIIKNPNEKIMREIIRNNPHKIVEFDNPPEDMRLIALEADGLILKKFKNPTVKDCEVAVAQNGYAFKYVPEELRTEEIKRMAVRSNPKLITELKDASPELKREAILADRNVFYLIEDASDAEKRLAISQNPALINSVKDASHELVQMAVEANPLLIRNFQFQYPDLREFALSRSGWAIRALHNYTEEEARLAIETTPECKVAIRNPEIASLLGIDNTPQIVIPRQEEPQPIENTEDSPIEETENDEVDVEFL